MVGHRALVGDDGELGGHFAGFFFRNNLQGRAVASAAEGQFLGIDDLSGAEG